VPDSARILFDLQHVSQVGQSISGCLKADEIAQRVTDALIEKFECAFARLWLVEPDQAALRLVASSGLHTHLNGSFARVPMGAYKVGKIAQNRVSFLSNRLADEPWVKDRDWAIANQIQGFAGYPLLARDRVIGVLAAFSCQPFASEFLGVLQILCTTVTIALDAALVTSTTVMTSPSLLFRRTPLSDQLATLLHPTCLTLVGTEQVLSLPLSYLLLNVVERLAQQHCTYCRLSYREALVAVDAILPAQELLMTEQARTWEDLLRLVTWLKGTLEIRVVSDRRATQVFLELPYCFPDALIDSDSTPKLSEREREVMGLLAQGLRDRDIAQTLFISESTVKFHINNSLTKLNAKNRYQGVYQAAIQGFI
jgi:DNA-binding CsgD family transcriptional regulator